jgi:hypothetical protein
MFYFWLIPLVLVVVVVTAAVFLTESKLGGGVRLPGTVLRDDGENLPDPPP